MGWKDSAMLPIHDPQWVAGDILGGSSSPVILPWSCVACCCCSRMVSRSWSPWGSRALDLPLNFWGGRVRASGSGTSTGFGMSSSLSVTVWRLLVCGCWAASRDFRLTANLEGWRTMWLPRNEKVTFRNWSRSDSSLVAEPDLSVSSFPIFVRVDSYQVVKAFKLTPIFRASSSHSFFLEPVSLYWLRPFT